MGKEEKGLSVEQIQFLKQLNADPADIVDVFEKVSDELMKRGFDDAYHLTKIGEMCEDILDILPDIDEETE
ncbi:MAG: hypothetical protein IKS37_11490 [Solobacterium sp.]|nr:hypothetical protein [Solobacterium sp.]